MRRVIALGGAAALAVAAVAGGLRAQEPTPADKSLDLEAVHAHGLSVTAMPSIDVLSVGGTISVNAHGADFRSGSLSSTVRSLRRTDVGGRRTVAEQLITVVRVYQREISPRRSPCCHFTPTCSAYAVEAL